MRSRQTLFVAKLLNNAGKGLIILLHGAPGTGKTSTAECVAELCKRPLYPITCGDLGTTAVEVEIFLRILEYYQGILFLTTNRVGKMDEAFRSRVHVSLYYPPLTEKSTIDIFETNLKRIKVQKGSILRIKEDDIRKFAKAHYKDHEEHVRWNGRQIRNAFHIAVALAENEVKKIKSSGEGTKSSRPTLRKKHFRKVEEASTKFDEYLTSVLGMGQSERAREKAYRQDSWREGSCLRLFFYPYL
ncbi:P-loop containing nucleoside triphosphate hydrolase protein [Trichoderma novae-zelandiae]